MSAAHRPWLPTGSTLSPMILQLRLENSGSRPAIYPSSVVQTGVKSFGCENRTAQPSPIQSWKLMVPCVVSAVKSGVVSLIRSDIVRLPTRWVLVRPCSRRRPALHYAHRGRATTTDAKLYPPLSKVRGRLRPVADSEVTPARDTLGAPEAGPDVTHAGKQDVGPT